MYLKKLELQGFKSFAAKTTLEFLKDSKQGKSITAIVGPNGSGKSNIAEAIRWALGEQSIKLLRGKKSEDVIFSGSEKRSRSGFAEVSLHLDNSDTEQIKHFSKVWGKDSSPFDYPEIVITRRVYRSGEGEYYLNKKRVRLQDILLILASANFGQRTYSVIGQGMIDSFLLQTPKERKEFFDEAAGVRPFQIKREEADSKLESTKENLKQVELLLQEIKPRLRSLTRQVNKLEERGAIEEELRKLQFSYYGRQWKELAEKYKFEDGKLVSLEERIADKLKEMEKIREAFRSLEQAQTASDAFLALQKEYEALIEGKNRLREREFNLKTELAVLSAKKDTAIRVPIAQITDEIEFINSLQDKIFKKVAKAKSLDGLKDIESDFDVLQKKTGSLLSLLKGSDGKAAGKSEELKQTLEGINREVAQISGKIFELQEKIHKLGRDEAKVKQEFFEIQRQAQAKQQEIGLLERERELLRVEIARFETRKEALEQEMRQEMGEDRFQGVALRSQTEDLAAAKTQEEIYSEIQKFKRQLELIGGIDPEIVKEYEETKKRYDFLDGQVDDLKQAIKSLEQVIEELDGKIKKQFEESFAKINDKFGEYFKMLFAGGSAKLIKVIEEVPAELPNLEPEADRAEETEAIEEEKEMVKVFQGIDISATPPGKKIKGIGVLSGGEKALTAIALLCAVIANNPSPFVALDEVDAALDESNSIRFAEILNQLTQKTQFIVITHNRATMQKAQVLYGVTMSDDGCSRLLSLKLEETG